jgi:hypothetical protein
MENQEEKQEQKQPTTQDIINSVKDTPEMAALLNTANANHLKLKEEELGGKFMGKAYNKVDAAYMEALGLKDRPKGFTTELVSNLGKENVELKKELEALRNKEPDKTVDTDRDNLYQSQLSELEKKIAELSQANADLVKTSRNKEVSNGLMYEASKLSLNAAIGSTLLEETKRNRISLAVMNSKEIDGETIYYNNENQPYMELGKPMSATQVVKELFKDLIQVKTPGGNAEEKRESYVKGDVINIPNSQNIKTFSQFNEEFEKAARAKGLTRKDKKYYDLQRATRDHYKFQGLPME